MEQSDQNAYIIIVTVGTPHLDDGSADFSSVLSVLKSVVKFMIQTR